MPAASSASSSISKLRLVSRETKRPSVKATFSAAIPMHLRRRCALPLAIRSRRCLGKHRGGVAHRAAGMGAAAGAHHIGIAEDDIHLSRPARRAGPTRPGQSSSHGPARPAGCRSPHRPRPSGRTRICACSLGAPMEDFDVIGEAEPASLPRRLASRRRAGKPFQSASPIAVSMFSS